MVGIPAAVGRAFAPEENREPYVVLSDAFRRRRFNAGPNVAGGTLIRRPLRKPGAMAVLVSTRFGRLRAMYEQERYGGRGEAGVATAAGARPCAGR